MSDCILCAGKCRGHSLVDAGSWEPEPGSYAARTLDAMQDKLEILPEDRIGAWEARPEIFGEDAKHAWMNGLYDRVSIIRIFARHRIQRSAVSASNGWREVTDDLVGRWWAYSKETGRQFETYRSATYDPWDQYQRYGAPTHYRDLPEPPKAGQ